MPAQHPDPLAFQSVPYVDVVVVVTGKEDPAADREGDGRDPAEDVVVHKRVELAVGAEVKQPARGVVRAGRERVAVGVEPVKVGRVWGVSVSSEGGWGRRRKARTGQR